jgi:hypothetical protein
LSATTLAEHSDISSIVLSTCDDRFQTGIYLKKKERKKVTNPLFNVWVNIEFRGLVKKAGRLDADFSVRDEKGNETPYRIRAAARGRRDDSGFMAIYGGKPGFNITHLLPHLVHTFVWRRSVCRFMNIAAPSLVADVNTQ